MPTYPAGKSSLGAAMFRLAELSSGSVMVDGVDLARLPLETVRSSISTITQEPVLFNGSIR